jgi:hypothetical protein
MAPADPLPVGTRVEVTTKGRGDYGVTGIITDTKPGDLWVRVWTDTGMAVWYSRDEVSPVASDAPLERDASVTPGPRRQFPSLS